MSKFIPRLEILPDEQKKIWPYLEPASTHGFILYGGTAIALQLGHRYSVDFDFFTKRSFDNDIIKESFIFGKNSEVIQQSKNTLTLLTSGSVKISFFGGINFCNETNTLLCDDNKIKIASLDDLMATKLKVLFDRVEAKDYQDIAAMLRNGICLKKGLSTARSMFGNNFQPSEALRALTFFKGGDLDKLSANDKNTIIESVKKVDEIQQTALQSSDSQIDLGFSNEKKIKKRHRMR